MAALFCVGGVYGLRSVMNCVVRPCGVCSLEWQERWLFDRVLFPR